MQLDLARIFTLFVIQLILAFVFLYLAFIIIKRNRKRLNISFSWFYISSAIAIFLNMAYALLFNEFLVALLNYFANFFVGYGLIFILMTNKMMLQSSAVFTSKQQAKNMIIYAILLGLSIIFYPFGGVIINETTDWRPVWDIYFFIYLVAIETIFAVVPILYTSFKIYRKMSEKAIKKRWARFFLGIIGLLIYLYLTFLSNLLNNPTFRLFATLYAITAVFWAALIYNGIGKQL